MQSGFKCNVVSLHFKYILEILDQRWISVYIYIPILLMPIICATKSTAHRSVHGYAYLPQGMRVCNEWKGNCV